jgi:hypothetical protein
MKFNASRRETSQMTTVRVGLAAGSGSPPRRAPGPPSDGRPLSTALKLRQHEVQVVSGPGGCVAAAWTDDMKLEGVDGWTCGYSVSLDGGKSWSTSRFHKRLDFAATGNPTIAVDTRGVVFAVSMSVQADYGSGLLELSHSTDAGRNWSPWRVIASKTNGIPDRPKLAVGSNGDLHLVFSNVERTGRKLRVLKSTIQAMHSTDRGQTWSEPKTISLGQHRSRWFIDGYQGPAILSAPNSVLLVSWADYYGNRVHFSSSDNSGADFKPPVSVRLQTLPGNRGRHLAARGKPSALQPPSWPWMPSAGISSSRYTKPTHWERFCSWEVRMEVKAGLDSPNSADMGPTPPSVLILKAGSMRSGPSAAETE